MPRPKRHPDQLLNLKAVCSITNVSPSTARKWFREGKLRVVRITRDPRVMEADLTKFIRSNRHTEMIEPAFSEAA